MLGNGARHVGHDAFEDAHRRTLMSTTAANLTPWGRFFRFKIPYSADAKPNLQHVVQGAFYVRNPVVGFTDITSVAGLVHVEP